MRFTKIDMATWPRKEMYKIFHDTVIYVTVQLDMTLLYSALREAHIKLYPAFIYACARVLNADVCFRYGRIDNEVGLFDRMDPYYTTPRRIVAI